MSRMFKSRDTQPTYANVADPYGSVREPTLDWVKGQIGKPADKYSGEFVAPSTAQEKQSLDFLQKYVDQGQSEGMNLANEEMRKTMTDQYDPTKSGYYQAVKAEAAKNLADVQANIGDQAAGGGRYWSGARLGSQAEEATNAGMAMNKLVYGMQETERGRKLAAAPFAAQLGQYQEGLPLQKAQALQSMGGLERTLQQARNDAIYNDWLRATQEYPLQIASLASGLSKEPYYAERTRIPKPIVTMLNDMTNPKEWISSFANAKK